MPSEHCPCPRISCSLASEVSGPGLEFMGPSSCRELQRLLPKIEKSRSVVYILDSHLRFTYCNPAWDEFALENQAPELTAQSVLGSELFAAIPAVLRPFYVRVIEDIHHSGLVWQHVYECSSPEQFRNFRMRIHPLSSGWLLVTNALVVERPHTNAICGAPVEEYANADGIITLCAHCRCSLRVDKQEQWDFVPAHLKKSNDFKVSHGLCPVCRAYFYPPSHDPTLEAVE